MAAPSQLPLGQDVPRYGSGAPPRKEDGKFTAVMPLFVTSSRASRHALTTRRGDASVVVWAGGLCSVAVQRPPAQRTERASGPHRLAGLVWLGGSARAEGAEGRGV